jgi:hypothetical protein
MLVWRVGINVWRSFRPILTVAHEHKLEAISRSQVHVHAHLPSLRPISWTRHEIFCVHLGYEPKVAHEIKYFALAQHQIFCAVCNFTWPYGHYVNTNTNMKCRRKNYDCHNRIALSQQHGHHNCMPNRIATVHNVHGSPHDATDLLHPSAARAIT